MLRESHIEPDLEGRGAGLVRSGGCGTELCNVIGQDYYVWLDKIGVVVGLVCTASASLASGGVKSYGAAD